MKRKTLLLVLLLACSGFLFTSCLNSDDSPQEQASFVVYKTDHMGSSEYFVTALGEKLNPGISFLTKLDEGDLVQITFTVDDYTADKNGFYKINLLNYSKQVVPELRTNGLDSLGKDAIMLADAGYCLDYLLLYSRYTGTDAKKHTFYIARDSVQKEEPKYFKNDTLFVELRHNAHKDFGSSQGGRFDYLNITNALQGIQYQTTVKDTITISVKYQENESTAKHKYIKWGKPKYSY